jgi:hypothetical protein
VLLTLLPKARAKNYSWRRQRAVRARTGASRAGSQNIIHRPRIRGGRQLTLEAEMTYFIEKLRARLLLLWHSLHACARSRADADAFYAGCAVRCALVALLNTYKAGAVFFSSFFWFMAGSMSVSALSLSLSLLAHQSTKHTSHAMCHVPDIHTYICRQQGRRKAQARRSCKQGEAASKAKLQAARHERRAATRYATPATATATPLLAACRLQVQVL